jgi:hypothetical protein
MDEKKAPLLTKEGWRFSAGVVLSSNPNPKSKIGWGWQPFRLTGWLSFKPQSKIEEAV